MVLYRPLTGHFPYATADASAPELARAVLDDAPRTPSRGDEAGPMLTSSDEALRTQFGDAHQRTRDAVARLHAFEADIAANR